LLIFLLVGFDFLPSAGDQLRFSIAHSASSLGRATESAKHFLGFAIAKAA
jgi:hypothetical protein